MIVQTEIIGDRVVLRRWNESHIDQLRSIVASSLDHIAAFMSSAATEVADPLAFIALVSEAWDGGEVFAYAIEEDHRLIGHITFAPKPPGGVIGCWIREEDVGRGFATEALAELTRAVFAQRSEVVHLNASCNAANTASVRWLEQAGFRCIERRTWEPRTPSETDEELIWRKDRA